MATWREGYVIGGRTRFYVRALGHGDDLVILLHGWPETGDCWRAVAPRLADAGWRVACPDLKGFGRTEGPRDGYDSRTLADEVSQLIRNLHARKAVLVGHDWGGAIALATVHRHPGRVRSIVLSNSPHRGVDLHRAWHIPLLNLPVVPELATRAAPRLLVRAAMTYAAHERDAFDDATVERYAEGIAGRGWLGYYRTLPRRAAVSAATRTVRRILPFTDPGSPPRLRVPAAVVWGERDPVLPRSVAERVAVDLDAELTLIPDVGHFPHEEDPDAFARAVLDHIGVVGEHVALEHR